MFDWVITKDATPKAEATAGPSTAPFAIARMASLRMTMFTLGWKSEATADSSASLRNDN